MQFRSSNSKFTHFQGDVLSNIDDSSHGVKLSGGSTGGLIEACGDETNIALTVRGKGSGGLTLGSSGSAVLIGGSTAPFGGFLRQVSSFATPNFASTNAMVMETTHAFTGINSSYVLVANGVNLSTDCALLNVYAASTAAQFHCRFAKVSTLTVAATTATISVVAIRF